MSRVIEASAFPAVIRETLRSVRWRQAGVCAGRAVAFSLAALIVTMVLAMIADWSLTLFDTGTRTLLTFSSLSIAAATLLYFGWRPVVEAFGWKRAATSVDKHIPQLEERWTTVAHFASSDVQPITPTSRAMLQQVTSEAIAMGRLVKPAKIVNAQSLRQPGLLFGASIVILGIFMACNWAQSSILFQRFWSPGTNITATQLTSLTKDATIPRGSVIEIKTQLSGLHRDDATFTLVSQSRPDEELLLTPDADNPIYFVCSIDVDDSFRYRVQAGDGRTQWHDITAVDFPAFSEVRLTVTPPSYVDDPIVEKTLIPGRLRALQGSYMELSMKPDSSLKKLELLLTLPEETAVDMPASELPGEATSPQVRKQRLTLSPASDGWYHFETQLIENFTLSPVLLNFHGLEDENRRVCRVQVITDKAPTARIISPNAEMAVDPEEVLNIKWEAHDDKGIASAELVVYDESDRKEGEEPKVLAVIPIPLGDQMLQKHIMGQTQLDLKKLGLNEDQEISYAVRVTDNRNLDVDENDLRSRMALASAKSDKSKTPVHGRESQQNDTEDSKSKPNQKEGSPSDTSRESDPQTAKQGPENKAEVLADADPSEDSGDRYRQMLENERKRDGESNPDRDGLKKGNPKDNNLPLDKPEGIEAEQTPAAEKANPDAPEEKENANSDKEGKKPDATKTSDRDPSADNNSGETKKNSQNDAGGAGNKKPKSGDSKSNANAEKVLTARADNDAKNRKDAEQKADSEKTPRDKQAAKDAPGAIQMTGQRSDAGQKRETNRRRLKISKQLAALAERNQEQKTGVSPARDKVIEIRKMLKETESELTALYQHEVDSTVRSELFKQLDQKLGDVEIVISDLHAETQNSKFEFAGLQMVDIGSTHVTPARDSVFVAIRTPDAGSDSHTERALHHVVSALELLDALLRKYDRVQRDLNLAEKLDRTIEMYTVVVEGEQQLLRAAQENRDPLKLKRQMAVVEVDQSYLDRLAEVRKMRRDMLAELGKILSDDPRLRSKYLDLIKRNRSSLRSQLAELFDRQDQITQEVNGWTQVSENQRLTYWLQISDLRMDAPKKMARSVQEFVNRIEKQMPLILNAKQGTPALVIELAKQIAIDVRRCDLDVRELRKLIADPATSPNMNINANELVFRISELSAALDQLGFENEGREGVDEYVTLRLAETRQLADEADVWAETTDFIQQNQFSGLAQVDQQQIAISTEILRLDMQDIEVELTGQFQGNPVPVPLTNLARQLLRTVERITFNQAAASFALSQDDIASAAKQQNLALDAFEDAEKLFDQLRRQSIIELDKLPVQNPDISQLRDPTLDQFLARLEREPNIEARLGIPRRPRNIRTLQESMLWSQNGGGMLGESRNAANGRAEEERKRRLKMQSESAKRKQKPKKNPAELTDEEKEDLAAAKDMQEMIRAKMNETLKTMEQKAADESASDEQREQMRQMAERMKQQLQQLNAGDVPEDLWDRLVESEQAQRAAEMLAAGEELPDEQWNKLMSTLDNGLWQVGNRTPPEDHRKSIEQYQDRIRELTGGVE